MLTGGLVNCTVNIGVKKQCFLLKYSQKQVNKLEIKRRMFYVSLSTHSCVIKKPFHVFMTTKHSSGCLGLIWLEALFKKETGFFFYPEQTNIMRLMSEFGIFNIFGTAELNHAS